LCPSERDAGEKERGCGKNLESHDAPPPVHRSIYREAT
jgi:hypothetical protein